MIPRRRSVTIGDMDAKERAKETAEADQALAMIAESFPPMLWRFYVNSKEEGFSEQQALTLTLEVLRGTFSGKREYP